MLLSKLWHAILRSSQVLTWYSENRPRPSRGSLVHVFLNDLEKAGKETEKEKEKVCGREGDVKFSIL